MRVLNYLELEGHLDRSGIGTAARQQRKALTGTEIEVITDPWAAAVPPVRAFDVAHLNLFGPASVLLARIATARDVPLVIHAHTTSEDFRDSFRGSNVLAGPLRSYLRWFYSQADLVLCPSRHTRNVLRAYPVTAPIRPITNGVDTASLRGHDALRDAYRGRYDLTGPVVFTVGNVFERKGLTTFCRVANRTPYDFVWFGPYDTGLRASPTVRRWIRDPPENVTFTGWIDDKRGAFGAGDIFFLPAKEENQGIAVLEAMACGKAVVLGDIPVFDEFFTHGEDCLKGRTAAELREAIDTLADDPDLRRDLGRSARATAANHALPEVGRRLRGAYEAALLEKHARDGR